MTQTVLITGISGQTGSFLAKHLVDQGAQVHGTSRGIDKPSWRLSHFGIENDVTLHAVGPDDFSAIKDLAARKFDKIFHLAAESSVASSLAHPSRTAQANLLQTTYWLEALRDQSPKTRFFNAASSEIFAASDQLLTEDSPFQATNPYAVTKLAAANMATVFRDSFDMFIVNGYLFNHESEMRDARFVTGKIIKNLCDMAKDKDAPAFDLGNIYAQRDFSHAEDFARAIALSLGHDSAQDYIFASGHLRSVKDFFNSAARQLGFDPRWSGSKLDEVCNDKSTGRKLVSINPEFYRPIDEAGKAGDSSRARECLNWTPEISFDALVARMIGLYA